jgi:hypothetical protein
MQSAAILEKEVSDLRAENEKKKRKGLGLLDRYLESKAYQFQRLLGLFRRKNQ